MEKPIELKAFELKKDIIDAINNSNLPPIIIKPILQELLNETIELENQRFQILKQQYDESLKDTREDIVVE